MVVPHAVEIEVKLIVSGSDDRAPVELRDLGNTLVNMADRLEEVYDRRPPTDYGRERKRWLFYQWVAWSMNSGE